MESAIRDVAISPCCAPPFLPASSPDDRRSTAAAAARSGPIGMTHGNWSLSTPLYSLALWYVRVGVVEN